MYVIFQGESLLIPATVTGDKGTISGLTAVIKSSKRGEIPKETDPTVATMTVEDYTSPEVTNGYLFVLANSSALAPGIYYVNYEFTAAGYTIKGVPFKIIVKESVV